MPQLKNYNLFISHSWAYSDAYEKLCRLLEKASNFVYSNYSIPKEDPVHTKSDSVLYKAIQQKITFCNVIIIMAGKYATYSKWIAKEIQIAKNDFAKDKPIIGVRPWANTQVSSLVQNNADALVGWNTSSIVDAIRGNAV